MQKPQRQSRGNSFAAQYLLDHGIEMFRGETRILNIPPAIPYKIKLPNTRFYSRDMLSDREEIREITRLLPLEKLGWTIVKKPVTPKTKVYGNQRVRLLLERTNRADEDDIIKYMGNKSRSGGVPIVQHDVLNKQIRLIHRSAGPMGEGPWLNIELKKPQTKQTWKYTDYAKESDKIIEDQILEWLEEEPRQLPVYIKETPIMITHSNELVCLPNAPDMPSILVTGQKRTGKSYFITSLVGRLHWKKEFDYSIAVLNDSSAELGTWCLPNQNSDQIYNLRRLNEKPLPLPTVYFHPMFFKKYTTKVHMKEVGFDITIPFKDIIRDFDSYLDMDKSARYFSNLAEELSEKNTQEEILEFLDDNNLKIRGCPAMTIQKIQAEIGLLMNKKITDITSERQEKWSTSFNPDKMMNPVTACINAGIIPILNTSLISNIPKLLALYFSYFAGDLFTRQKEDPDFIRRRSRLMLVVDEAHNISGTTSTRNGPADLLLRRCVREGGPRSIGTIIGTQKYNELPEVIKGNTTHLICFNNPQEASEIASTYALGKENATIIKRLAKHEFLAYTTDYFIVYDSEGNKRKSMINEVFVGKSLPPYNQHMRPRSKT